MCSLIVVYPSVVSKGTDIDICMARASVRTCMPVVTIHMMEIQTHPDILAFNVELVLIARHLSHFCLIVSSPICQFARGFAQVQGQHHSSAQSPRRAHHSRRCCSAADDRAGGAILAGACYVKCSSAARHCSAPRASAALHSGSKACNYLGDGEPWTTYEARRVVRGPLKFREPCM